MTIGADYTKGNGWTKALFGPSNNNIGTAGAHLASKRDEDLQKMPLFDFANKYGDGTAIS